MSAPLQIISADERLREQRGAKVLLLGSSGVGKTWQLHTLDPQSTLFCDYESGDLSVQDVKVDTIRIADWMRACDLACRISGPNPSYPPTAVFSQAHFDAIGGWLPNLQKYRTVFIDSLTALSRLSFRHAEQAPEAISERTGRKDVRSIYGAHARQLLALLNQFQYSRSMQSEFWNVSLTISMSRRGSCNARAAKPRASCPA
jgi:hypothetical protein